MLFPFSQVNLALRATMESAIVVGLAYWGYRSGTNAAAKTALAIGAPAVVFGVWGMVDFHQARRFAEPLRLLEELVISGVAAVALYVAGQPVLAWALAGLSIVYHVLVYAHGEKLLKQTQI